MIRACIDIGTNTFLLTIVQIDSSKKIKVLCDQMQIVRLGEQFDSTKIIQPKATERAIQALKSFRKVCEKYRVSTDSVRVVGTSAVREANNQADFIHRIYDQTGFLIAAISGEEEARLSWKGALSSLPSPFVEPCLVDIGGGSTELIWDQGDKSKSFPLGVVKARERFFSHDPPLEEEIEKLRLEMRMHLRSLPQISIPQPLIGVAGTATTIGAIAEKVEPYDGRKVHGMTIDLIELDLQIKRFMNTCVEERKSIPGLQPERADLIPAGAVMLQTICQFLGVKSFLISDRGLRFGVVLDKSND